MTDINPGNGSPRDYGLPHDEWRDGQMDSISWCQDIASTSSDAVLEAPTGSGKTSMAKAVSISHSVIALCRTMNLQIENYGDKYGATVLMGRANYECVHPDADEGARCSECLYADTSMHKCEVSHRCPYVMAREEAMGSPFTSLNYHYFLAARWPRQSDVQVLFLDEAHQLSDITLDFAGSTITHRDQVRWALDRFPDIEVGAVIKIGNPVGDALGWLYKSREVVRKAYRIAKLTKNRDEMARCENFGNKLSATIDALESTPDDWYIKSGEYARKYGNSYQPGFIARPLTARHHFPRYFLDGHSTIAMSATIGDFDAFSDELGIGQHRSLVVPNRFEPKDRKVHILDVPRMGYKSTSRDFEKQADSIAKAILSRPDNWPGIIHVTRKNEAALLSERLAQRGLRWRVWAMPGADGQYIPSAEQVAAWNSRKASVPGSICVTWSLWEGYDGIDEKICIIAKVPFPFLGDPYEKARLEYSKEYYGLRTANQLEQGAGRTRRGFDGDYGDDNGFVAIADGNWTRVKKYLSAGFREAIVE